MTKTFIGVMILIATLAASPSAYASEVPATTTNDIIVITTTDTSSETVITTEAAAQAELKSLKLKEQDPTIGFFTRLIIGFKIKQLENQLNIKKALK